jgi:hypothetical protein
LLTWLRIGRLCDTRQLSTNARGFGRERIEDEILHEAASIIGKSRRLTIQMPVSYVKKYET